MCQGDVNRLGFISFCLRGIVIYLVLLCEFRKDADWHPFFPLCETMKVNSDKIRRSVIQGVVKPYHEVFIAPSRIERLSKV